MVFSATFNSISVISWPAALLVEEIGEPGENHRPVASHRHHYYIMLYSLSSSRFELTRLIVMGIDCIGSCKFNYHTNTAMTSPEKTYLIWFDLIYCGYSRFQQYFSYVMAISFSGGRSRSTRTEPQTMGKQLVNFIACGCESSAPFLLFTNPGANPRRVGDRFVSAKT